MWNCWKYILWIFFQCDDVYRPFLFIFCMFSSLSWSQSGPFLRLPHSHEEPPASESPSLWECFIWRWIHYLRSVLLLEVNKRQENRSHSVHATVHRNRLVEILLLFTTLGKIAVQGRRFACDYTSENYSLPLNFVTHYTSNRQLPLTTNHFIHFVALNEREFPDCFTWLNKSWREETTYRRQFKGNFDKAISSSLW